MQTFEVTILESKAEAMLDEMENEKLIKVSKPAKNGDEKKPLQRGSMKGLVVYMADDFNEPLEDFAEYM